MTDDEITLAYTQALSTPGALMSEVVLFDQDDVERDRIPVVWLPMENADGRGYSSCPARAIDIPSGWYVDFKAPIPGKLGVETREPPS